MTLTTTTTSLDLYARQDAAQFIASYKGKPTPHRLVIGGAIAGPDASNPSVLIVQRAASERSYPNEWEIPGGHVDPGESILDAVSREIHEETGLSVTKVICEFDGFHYWTTKFMENESKNAKDNTYSVCTLQLNFCVQVSNSAMVVLNPEEHQKYAWCTAATIDQFSLSPDMRKVVANALSALLRIRSIDKSS
ncbi:hypothetical protein H4R20_004658 [Coemansia guatemalensis]|uniref:Nudix hydrolase domain-containing protein n=1 Tax=Coemansia guatemalensis TaxID=2761395 RepID=A0A9W8HRB9_9FUNG|nr:hypothetical protein H4R20_004658 [Coemansia guatemalensis]